MDNKITVYFEKGSSRESVYDLFQWSYGQILEIKGVDIGDAAVWVQVSMSESEGEAVPVLTDITDGVITAKLPEFVFTKDTTRNYSAYVFVYVSDVNFGKTVKVIKLNITSRAKPSDYIYTEEELTRYESLEDRIERLEEQGTGGGGGYDIVVDSELSEISENPVQNKVVAEHLKKTAIIDIEDNEDVEEPDSELQEIIIDVELSKESANPVQNKVVATEFEKVFDEIGEQEKRIDNLSKEIVDKVTIQNMIDNKFNSIVNGNEVAY